MYLENYVSELLLRHNCLIIPGFGGFVARYSPAKIDWNKGFIAPPSKELLFNKHLVQNDGLLVNHIAINEKLNFIDATGKVDGIVNDWKHTLKNGGRVEIEKVGILYHDFDGNTVFEQDRFFNLLLSSFGLKEVTFIAEERVVESVETEVKVVEKIKHKTLAPVIKLEKETEKPSTLNPKTEKEIPLIPIASEKKHGFNWKYLAAAVIIPFGFFMYWIPMKTDVLQSGKIAIADFNPFRAIPSSEYSLEKLATTSIDEELHYSWDELIKDLPKEIEVFNYRFSEELYIPVRLIEKDKTDVVSDVVDNFSSNTSKKVVESNQYHLIAGCFSSKENADNLVTELKAKGHNAQILDVNKGLHRVSVDSFNDKTLASKELSALQSQGIATWVLKK